MKRISLITALCIALLPGIVNAQWEYREVISRADGYIAGVKALTDTSLLAVSSRRIVYLSQDAGWTWSVLDTLPQTGVVAIGGFIALNAEEALLVSIPRVYRIHVDSGVTWQSLEVVPDDAGSCEAAHRPFWLYRSFTGELWLQSDSLVHTSRDNGRTWRCESDSNLLAVAQRYRMYFIDDSLGLAVWAGDHSSMVTRTTDRGASWTTTQFKSGLRLLLPGRNGTHIAVGESQWVSSDSGATWRQASSPNLWACSTAVRIDSLRSVAAGALDVICTIDGGITWYHGIDLQWSDRDRLPNATSPSSMEATSSGRVYLTHQTGVLISSTGCSDTIVSVSNRTPEVSPAFRVVPNPATEEITLSVENGPTTFVVTSTVTGQELFTVTVDVAGAPYHMDVSTLPTGHYLITRRDQHGLQTQAFVKL